MKVIMTRRGVPIARKDKIIRPEEGEIIEVSDSIGESLIRGGDAMAHEETEQTPAKRKPGRPKKKKMFEFAPENK